jgi:hypothetical protein
MSLPYDGSVIRRHLVPSLATLALCACGFAQEPIRFLADKKLWVLTPAIPATFSA